jgi:hypothetical protein
VSSFAEFPYLNTEEELMSHVAADLDKTKRLQVTIDQVQLQDLHQYRMRYGPFDLRFGQDNIWNLLPGTTKAVSDGFWIFLHPLVDGEHSIRFSGVEPNFHTDVVYSILIKGQPNYL